MAINTPWGLSQSTSKIAYGVISVSTAGHGGLGVSKVQARKLLSDAALLCANYSNGYYWFEEDCQCCVAFLEHPEWSSSNSNKDVYETTVKSSYPQYYEYLASNAKAPREPSEGQFLRILRKFSNVIEVGDVVKVVEVRANSIVFTHPKHNLLWKVPMAHVLGEGFNSIRCLELVA